MNPKDHRKDFNRRWKITSSDSPEEAFSQFKQRILNIFTIKIHHLNYEGKIDKLASITDALNFRQYYGIPENRDRFGNSCTINDRLFNEKDEKEFYRLIEVILNLDFVENHKFFIDLVKDAIQISDVNVTMTLGRNGRMIFYPEGEKKLDEELVNKTLSFLNEKSNHHFEEALRLCQKSKRRQSAEELRRSLEEFLRHKLKNTKGLKENIKKLRENLKEAGSPPEIGNISHKIFEIFGCLDKYFNEHSKHKNRNIPDPENEFLIYQTGLLLRYINSLDLTQNQKNKI